MVVVFYTLLPVSFVIYAVAPARYLLFHFYHFHDYSGQISTFLPGYEKSTATFEDYGTFKPFGTVNSQCILRTCYKFFRICLLSPLPQSELYS